MKTLKKYYEQIRYILYPTRLWEVFIALISISAFTLPALIFLFYYGVIPIPEQTAAFFNRPVTEMKVFEFFWILAIVVYIFGGRSCKK